ncbi:isochorismatase family protein [Nonomuraea sp. SYSU D8015]|uniref:isochorismatase family protein n=1 Tax=Nonomuraea sp. SYSU D8015 TaxID=2593644 RepID=UPI001660E068|nr:isochorismatase family protein [Nonomuraea sp. SYSU D8015]
MSLPSIDAYLMPDSPVEGRVTWPIDHGRAALLIHDMQNYFLRAFPQPAAPPLADLMANVLSLREACVQHGIPVLYSRQPGGQSRAQRGLLLDFWGPGLSANPFDTAIPDPLAPRPGDHVIDKTRYSAFHHTHLAEVLAGLDRTQLIICGVYAHIGVLTTATDAMMRDIQPFVAADGVADFSRDHHEAALRHISDRVGRVMATRAIITALSQQRLAVSGR